MADGVFRPPFRRPRRPSPLGTLTATPGSRGFGATFGAGSTDKITSVSLTGPSAFSFHALVYRVGDGGGGNGRLFSWSTESVQMYTDAGGTMQFFNQCSGGSLAGIWTCPRPAASGWYGIGGSLDRASITNDPLLYVDGVSQTVTETLTPAGAYGVDNGTLNIGNRGDNVRNWDGMLARFAVWNRILTPAEFALLGIGYSPLAFPTGLVEFIAMGQPNGGFAGTPTIVGTVPRPAPNLAFLDATSLTGTATSTLAPLTSEATGALAITGTATATLEALTSSGAGVLPITGVAGGTLAPLTAVATAALALAGIATSELAPLTGTATGAGQDPASVGAGDVTLAPLTAVAPATLGLAATATATLAPLTGTATGTHLGAGTGGAYWSPQYWAPTYWGRRYWSHGPVELAAGTGVGEVTLEALTAVAAATLAVTGAVTSTLAPLTSIAAGTSGGILGVGDVTLAPLTGVATTQQGILGVGNVTLAPLTAVGTAHVGPPVRPMIVLSDETFGIPSAMYETLVIAGGP